MEEKELWSLQLAILCLCLCVFVVLFQCLIIVLPSIFMQNSYYFC